MMRHRSLIALLAVATGTACGDSTGTQMAGNVAVSVATQSPRVAPSAVAFARAKALDDTIVSGGDTVIVTRAQLVLREIEFERDDNACNVEEAPGCEEVEFGPLLIDLPLEPGAQREVSAELPAGVYNEVEFDVHKPDDDDPLDMAFIQQHPDFADISIRVQGTFIQGTNSSSFMFESDLNVKQELGLVPPLAVEETTVTNVTVFVALDGWFRRQDGTLVDPASANKGAVNENLVRDNIIASFRAFEDRDEDGDDRDG